MATQETVLTRDALAALPVSYFQAVDARDVAAVCAHFAAAATLTVQTDHVTFTGEAEIRRMFSDFFANSTSITHEITNVVVDETTARVATEQNYVGELADGTRNNMHNCNFFDVGADGRFTRMIIWMAGTNPLK
jgi:ketosteroid isomerase-like protein